MANTRMEANEHANKAAENGAQAARTSVHEAAAAGQHATDQAVDAGRRITDEAAEAGRHAADKAAEVARTTAREGAHVAQQAARAVQDTVRSGANVASRLAERSSERFTEALTLSDRQADEVARAGEHAVRAGAEAARRGTETAQQTARSGLNMAADMAQRSLDQFTRAFSGDNADEAARIASRNLQALTDSGAVFARGFQDISQEWVTFAQKRLQQNFEGLNRLSNCRSLQDMVQVQSDLARTGLAEAIEGTRRIAQVSLRVADEAGQKIAAQGDRADGEASRHSVEIDRNRQRQARHTA